MNNNEGIIKDYLIAHLAGPFTDDEIDSIAHGLFLELEISQKKVESPGEVFSVEVPIPHHYTVVASSKEEAIKKTKDLVIEMLDKQSISEVLPESSSVTNTGPEEPETNDG